MLTSDRGLESANAEIVEGRIDSGGEYRVAVMDHETIWMVERQ
jgi:hypothetical protein